MRKFRPLNVSMVKGREGERKRREVEGEWKGKGRRTENGRKLEGIGWDGDEGI